MNINSTQGVYKITNKINGKIYIGSTTTPFSLRFGQHKCQLRGNRHFNPHLQYSWNKYGESNFEFSPIEICDASSCMVREQHYIDTLHPAYNVILKQRTSVTYKHNQTTKDRISLAFKGRNHPLYSGDYIFYHPKHGYFTGGLQELSQKHGFCDTAGYKLKNGLLSQSHGWIYIGKASDPLPVDINATYQERIKDKRPSYTFINELGKTYNGKISDFATRYKLDNSTIYKLVKKKRKTAFGWKML